MSDFLRASCVCGKVDDKILQAFLCAIVKRPFEVLDNAVNKIFKREKRRFALYIESCLVGIPRFDESRTFELFFSDRLDHLMNRRRKNDIRNDGRCVLVIVDSVAYLNRFGGEVGEMEYENFNAAKAVFKIQGLEVHPGYAKGKMINASLLAAELIQMFPACETPGTTEGYEGFYHLVGLSGEVDHASAIFIIRDHDRSKFEARKAFAQSVADKMNAKYGAGTVVAEVSDQYYNMKEQIDKVPYVVDIACEAMKLAGVNPVKVPIRGGTDGAQLSFKGLPCPNLFAGGMNFHGRYEWVPVQSMEKAMMTVVRIIEIVAQRSW